MNGRDVYIAGIGSFSPGEPVPFDRIEDVLGKLTHAPKRLMKRIERMRPIMKEMLGIDYSHYALDPETREFTENNISMAIKSSNKALEMAGIEASEIDLIVYAGIFYDYMCPPSSVLVQEELKIPYCAEMSIHSNCTSIYKALQVAADLIANGRYNKALVVSAQLSSVFLRAEYFNQEVITEEEAVLRWFLSDGAGAVVLDSKKPEKPSFKITDTYLESVGLGIEPTMKMVIGAHRSNMKDIYANGWHHLTQNLKVVGSLSPKMFRQGVHTMLEKTQLDVSRVKCFFANIPTKHLMDLGIKELREDFKNPNMPFYTKLSTRGYPGAPAILIALDEYLKEADLSSGDILVSFVTESSKWMHAGFVLQYC